MKDYKDSRIPISEIVMTIITRHKNLLLSLGAIGLIIIGIWVSYDPKDPRNSFPGEAILIAVGLIALAIYNWRKRQNRHKD